MSQIDLYLQTHEGAEPKLLKIASDATVDDLLKAALQLGAAIGEFEETLFLQIENEEKTLNRKHRLSDCGVRHGHHVHFLQKIIVNGTPVVYHAHEISFAQVAKIAYPDYSPTNLITYRMTYKHGPKENHEGSMVPGQTVVVKNHMVFNVTPTGRS